MKPRKRKEKESERKALRKENESLRRELAMLKAQAGKSTENSEGSHRAKKEGSAARAAAESKSYAEYLWRSLRASNIYSQVRRAMRWFSKFRIISTAMRLLAYAAAVIETGTQAVIVSTLFIVLLPAAVTISLLTLLISSVGSARASRELSAGLDGKRIFVFFPESPEELSEKSPMRKRINELSSSQKNAVFIVSPRFFGRAGIEKGKYYLHYRRERGCAVMLRKYYYFSFRKNVLSNKRIREFITVS